MKKEQPILNFNDFGTIKRLLGQGLFPASPGNPNAVGANHTSGQAYLSESDKNSISYFWLMRGDLERWCDWESKKDLVARELPHLVYAWEMHCESGRALTRICEQLGQEVPESGSPDGAAPMDSQGTQISFGRPETIEEEMSYKHPHLEPLDE